MVNTQNNFKKIKAIGITSPNSEKIKIETKNFELSGSPFHRVLSKNNWTFLKELKDSDWVLTKNGYEKIELISQDNIKEDLWDIEVDGTEYYSNGIVSHNSSLLDSFDYTLYGKVRGRKKKWTTLSTLPNRINGELLNRIKFKSQGVDVEVRRGISPNILELVENGILNDRAGKSNIEDKIEKYVGMDIETFKSFISMSIDSFKNFISLSNEEKQMLLDKLFNLEVINILNGILKDIVKNNKIKMASFDSEIKTLDESIESIQKSIQKSIEKEKENTQLEIDSIVLEMNSKKEEYKLLKEKVDKIKEKEIELLNEYEKERKQLIITQGDIKNVQKEIDLYDSGKCPVCKTDFNSEHFISLRGTLVDKKKEFQNIQKEIEDNILKIKERQTKLKILSEKTTKSFNDLTYLLKNYKSQIDKLNQKKSLQTGETSVNVQEFQKTIEELQEKKSTSSDNISICKDKDLYYKELNKIFGEDGVKRSIIAGIIKPINHFIGENVRNMGLPFDVKLDETFTAEIRQLGGIIEHDSLSTGENKLLNICIMCSYLMLVKSKKHINILFLDEVFSSVDIENINKILMLLKSFATQFNVNIFVVHHAILNNELFDRILLIEKNVFSQITDITNSIGD
jgi:DNA repair exonuclease SbcCD ATPase subunit